MVTFFTGSPLAKHFLMGSSGTPTSANAARLVVAAGVLDGMCAAASMAAEAHGKEQEEEEEEEDDDDNDDAGAAATAPFVDLGSGEGRIGVHVANALLWAERHDLLRLFRLPADATDTQLDAALDNMNTRIVYVELEEAMSKEAVKQLLATANALPGLVANHAALRDSTRPAQVNAAARMLRPENLHVYCMDGHRLGSLRGFTTMWSGDRVLPPTLQKHLYNLVDEARGHLQYWVTCQPTGTASKPWDVECSEAVCQRLARTWHLVWQHSCKLAGPGGSSVTYYVLVNKNLAQLQLPRAARRVEGMKQFEGCLLRPPTTLPAAAAPAAAAAAN